MSLPDAIFAVGSVLFALALIPSLRSADKPALKTSLLTACVLAVYTVTFACIGLWFAAATDGIVTVMWFTLFCQKVIADD